ncbi:hypothetical protein [Roseibium algae]|uniref:Uncharacterized protein n=1 Tax=Roseibium algae TaxID=3123038 RepID=A0ABU8TGG1_9HYPH
MPHLFPVIIAGLDPVMTEQEATRRNTNSLDIELCSALDIFT